MRFKYSLSFKHGYVWRSFFKPLPSFAIKEIKRSKTFYWANLFVKRLIKNAKV